MNTVKERVARDLDALDAAWPLARLVDDIVRDYPDASALANEYAQTLLIKHTGRAMAPRFVWWHQFQGTSVNSAASFTGWQHSGSPQKSMRLAELVIERFDVGFQEAPDELAVYGGFYRQGPHASHFDERNEVRLLPTQVQDDLWAIDFAVVYRARIEHFWSTYGSHFRTLAKVNVLGQAASAARAGRIRGLDRARVRALVVDGLAEDSVPTLAMLQQDSTQGALAIYRYALGQSDHGCLYSLEAQDGRVMLYLPWTNEALKAFDSALAMAGWLREQLQNEATLDAFKVAAHTNAQDPSNAQAVKTHLHSIAGSASAEAALVLLTFIKRPLSGNLFTYLADLATREMRQSAGLMLDNAQLRKWLWSGYLGAFLKVFGGIAPLGWPVSLTVLGASIAKVGLEVDAAVHAPSELARKAALRAAMFDSVLAALNLVDVSFQSSFASLAYEAPAHEAQASLESWQVARYASLPVEGQESNALVAGELVQSGRLRGITVAPDGSCWILLNGLSYRVRYSHDLACWLVVPVENPYAFGPLRPVRLNAAGEWELLIPPQLAGGAPPPIPEVADSSSPFWDIYTSIDGVQSGKTSATAYRRQKALLEAWMIPSIQPGHAPDLDEHGLDCVMTRGTPEYSYRHQREYFNSLIEYYTSDESRVNNVFRHGEYVYGDEDSYIARLADSLERLPKSNAVTLFRGGNAARGTGGSLYRTGQLKVGDVLVNTDLTSFSENPYKAVEFASQVSSPETLQPARLFDDSSVIFELPAGRYEGGTPISAFSLYWQEAETLFLPGHYFRVDRLEQVYGASYRFILVSLSRTARPLSGLAYDLRTGQLFDLQAYRARIRTPSLVQRFFPPQGTSSSSR